MQSLFVVSISQGDKRAGGRGPGHTHLAPEDPQAGGREGRRGDRDQGQGEVRGDQSKIRVSWARDRSQLRNVENFALIFQ